MPSVSDLQLESRLNQPLHARIEILDVSDEDWRQIHARVAPPEATSDGFANPRILESITFHATEEIDHRRFIEVSSTEALTEPLFELPIEVGGHALLVVRSYWVMLDPPGAEDGRPASMVARQEPPPAKADDVSQPRPRQVAQAQKSNEARASRQMSARGSHGATGAQLAPAATYTVTRSDTLERIARRLGARTAADRSQLMQWIFQRNPTAFYGDVHHLHAGARLTLPESIAAPRVVAKVATRSQPTQEPQSPEQPEQKQAQQQRDPQQQGQQQTPGEQQKALEGQLDSLQQMLAKMQETITAQDAQIASLTRKMAASAVPPAQSLADDSDEDDSSSVTSRVRPIYYWIAGLGVAVILAAVVLWRRREGASRVAPDEAHVAPKDAHVRDLPPKKPPPFERPAAAEQRLQPTPLPAEKPSLMRQEDRKASAPQEDNPNAPSGSDLWRTQTALLLSDLPSDTDGDTDVLPFVTSPESIAPSEADTGPAPAKKDKHAPLPKGSESIEHSATNREIVKILEDSLHDEPGRVDIQLKLLELYHHEALGNRENFHSLLHKLSLDPHGLSASQRSYVEQLQRSLQESKSTTDPRIADEVAV